MGFQIHIIVDDMICLDCRSVFSLDCRSVFSGSVRSSGSKKI